MPFALLPLGGIGLKPQHYSAVLADAHPAGRPGWVEVHPQNYFCDGGPPHRWLTAIADILPISFHSTGLSLGSADGLNADELAQLATLCERYQPASVSDHLSWSGNAHDRYADLLPVPYTAEALAHFSEQVNCVQDRLQRAMLIENPSRYLSYRDDSMTEIEFLQSLCRRTGCGLLFDINNVDVSAVNLGFDAEAYIDTIDPAIVCEIHLAGHSTEHHPSGPLKIDDHGSAVSDRCWRLYDRFLARAGTRPTLIEWDSDVPDYGTLMGEHDKIAGRLMVANGARLAFAE